LEGITCAEKPGFVESQEEHKRVYAKLQLRLKELEEER
jgi:hypothetical protein